MELYYFGDSKSPLLGCHLEPQGAAAREHGVVVCAPIAQEYVRTHWALRQLGAALARAGYHVMRFDYSCVGDSAGESHEGDVERWSGDIRTAVEELRDAAGVRKVSLIGLRLGAALAARAIEGGRLKIDTLVMWDPVVSGRAYLAELARVHQQMLVDPKRFGFSLRRDLDDRFGRWVPWLRMPPPREPDGELVGFAFPPSMRRGIEAIDLAASPPAARRVVLVCSEPRAEYDALRAAVERAGCPVVTREVGARGRWSDVVEVENALLPGDAPRVIEAALSSREPS